MEIQEMMVYPILVPTSYNKGKSPEPMKSLYIVLCFIFLFNLNGLGQRWENNTKDFFWGAQAGISIQIGTHITQVGLKLQGYIRYKFVQFNTGDQIRFNAFDLSGAKDYFSQRINMGIVLLGGKRDANPQLILTGLNHQSKYEYGLAYNYLWYLDNIGTRQVSGGFALHIEQLSFVVENDLFGGQGRDRFRTSYAGIFYHNGLFNLGINTILWTGETRKAPLYNPKNEYEIGYKDLSEMPFGKISHGIFSLSLDYQIFYGNTLSCSIGIDDEHVRNILQNRFIHNKKFVPKKIRKPNPNYLMLDKSGFPVVNKNDSVRPARFYLELGINRSLTY